MLQISSSRQTYETRGGVKVTASRIIFTGRMYGECTREDSRNVYDASAVSSGIMSVQYGDKPGPKRLDVTAPIIPPFYRHLSVAPFIGHYTLSRQRSRTNWRPRYARLYPPSCILISIKTLTTREESTIQPFRYSDQRSEYKSLNFFN